MKTKIHFIWLVLIAGFGYGACCAENIDRETVLRWVTTDTDQHPLGVDKSGKFDVSSELAMDYAFSSTSKANGILTMGGLDIQIYDRHNDGAYYDGTVLNIGRFTIKSEAYLIFSGIVRWTGEKGEIDQGDEVVVVVRVVSKDKLEIIYENPVAKKKRVIVPK